MKKIFTLLSLLACMFVNAQEAKETMRVHSNGEVVEFAVADIDSVTFEVPEWTAWEEYGTCTYTLNGYWNGEHPGLSIYYRESNYDDNAAQFYIPGIANSMDMTIDYDRTTGNCSVPVQYVTDNPTYGPVYVSDMPNYPLQPGLSYEKYPCTYNKETGTFTLTLVYFVSKDLGGSDSGYFAAAVTETIQITERNEDVGIASIEDYAGEWMFDIYNSKTGETTQGVGTLEVVEIDGISYIQCSGFANRSDSYNDAFLMNYDKETGLVTILPAQPTLEEFTYEGQPYPVWVTLSDKDNTYIYWGNLIGSLVDDKIKFECHDEHVSDFETKYFCFYSNSGNFRISDFNSLVWTRVNASNAPAKSSAMNGVVKDSEIRIKEIPFAKTNIELKTL